MASSGIYALVHFFAAGGLHLIVVVRTRVGHFTAATLTAPTATADAVAAAAA